MSIVQSVSGTVLLVLIVECFGCAAFRTGSLDAGVLPSALDPKQGIAVVVTRRWRTGDEPDYGVITDIFDPVAQEIVAAYRKSGLFSFVKFGVHDAELRAEVVLHRASSYNAPLRMLARLTAFFIPTYIDEVLTMTTVFRGADGEEVAKIQRQQAVISWHWSLFLPIMPFAYPDTVLKKIREELVTATLSGLEPPMVGGPAPRE
jgi:hypothetical protein